MPQPHKDAIAAAQRRRHAACRVLAAVEEVLPLPPCRVSRHAIVSSQIRCRIKSPDCDRQEAVWCGAIPATADLGFRVQDLNDRPATMFA